MVEGPPAPVEEVSEEGVAAHPDGNADGTDVPVEVEPVQ